MPFSRSPVLSSEDRRPEFRTRGGPVRHPSRARRVAASGRRVSRPRAQAPSLRAGAAGGRDARHRDHPVANYENRLKKLTSHE